MEVEESSSERTADDVPAIGDVSTHDFPFAFKTSLLVLACTLFVFAGTAILFLAQGVTRAPVSHSDSSASSTSWTSPPSTLPRTLGFQHVGLAPPEQDVAIPKNHSVFQSTPTVRPKEPEEMETFAEYVLW